MKTAVNIFILIILFVSLPVVALYNLTGYQRHIVVQLRHDHGAVLIKNTKVRVPYTIQETAVPATVSDPIEYLLLNNYNICLLTALCELAMGLLLIGIFYVNTVDSKWYKYRPALFKYLVISLMVFGLSEVSSFYVTQNWIIDTENGINGNYELFGTNITFPAAKFGSLNLTYQVNLQVLLVPVVALVVLMLNAPGNKKQVG